MCKENIELNISKEHHIVVTFMSALNTSSLSDEYKTVCEKAFNKEDLNNLRVYNITQYEKLGPTKTTNESCLKYLLQGYSNFKGEGVKIPVEKVFLFASDTARKKVRIVNKKNKNLDEISEYNLMIEEVNTLDVLKRQLQDCMDKKTIEKMFSEDSILECPDVITDVSYLISNVIQMAGRISSYVANVCDDDSDVYLHADITGGPRDAVMTILAIVRLAQYSTPNLKIGQILYGNLNKTETGRIGHVYDAKRIYDLFDIIAGAEEFSRFGSVKTLKDVFWAQGGSIDVETKKNAIGNLVASMDQFADAVQISRRSQFEQSIQQLNRTLQEFDRVKAKFDETYKIYINKSNPIDLTETERHSLNAKANYDLVGLLTGRLKQSYATIVNKEKIDVCDIISWCLDRRYIQQALSLYVECIPDYLVENGIIIVNKHTSVKKEAPSETRDTDKKVKTINKSSNIYTLLTEFDENEEENNRIQSKCDKASSLILGVWKELLMEFSNQDESTTIKEKSSRQKGQYNSSSVEKAFKNQRVDVQCFVANFKAQLEDREIYIHDDGGLIKFFCASYEEPKNALQYKTLLSDTASSALEKQVSSSINGPGYKLRKSMFDLVIQNCNQDVLVKFLDYSVIASELILYKKCKRIYDLFLAEKIAVPAELAKDDLYRIMNDYYTLKPYRNAMAHAHDNTKDLEEDITSDDLIRLITGSIEKIQQVKAKIHK
ncbi:TM1812 family CRISPR-associated protein [Veillonella criceti]|uniref:CRISPR-associated (Cas) DxTHG family n=1 Tax=Veillonella criceti TaxID=103891 RepID=A0A380NLF4_9FIRM|nr:TM1812 family CRISPR-associated protein [Veillonella criceti]SUP43079.1 Uncharacterised protein [Veillonella criceti]